MSIPSSSIKKPKSSSRHYPPPPPTPRILHLPRRPRRRPPAGNPTSGEAPRRRERKPKLETLFDQERPLGGNVNNVPIVVLDCSDHDESIRSRESDGLGLEEEKWRFQAEMLRAECNLLRMEKGIAIKKLHRARAKMERTLKSAVQTLVSGRIKICEGKDVDAVLEEEIQELTEKLEKLQRRSGAKDSETRNNSNFDRQVSVLRRWLHKNGGSSDGIYVRGIQQMAEASFSTKKCSRNDDDDHIVSGGKLNVEILRRKMEGLSKGILLQRMEEEYNSMLSTASISLANSASTTKRLEFQDLSAAIRVPHQEKVGGEGNMCYGQCKAVVQRIVEEVRAETEQWSLMQEMLGQVREEMEELQASRDFWEDCAVNSDYQIQTLHNAVQEWKQRALSSETKTNELEAKLSVLRLDLETLRKDHNTDVQPAKYSPVSSETQTELEKRILVCYSKENNSHTNANNHKKNEVSIREGERTYGTRGAFFAPKRRPFRDVKNSSSLLMR
ncbi:myosin-10 isoform X3 [Senna tora]|uniref:Myosin-10 isoform X3 n=1 Tax=Senna tora TaxID=362788 RepID=A0A834WT15_9FABA|nr:myosin-10 isoform X3 [Senna tora]